MYDKYTTCNIQEVNRLRQEAHYFRLGGLLSQLAEVAGPRLGVDGAVMKYQFNRDEGSKTKTKGNIQNSSLTKAEYLLCGPCIQPKKQFKVQIIAIFEEIDPLYDQKYTS